MSNHSPVIGIETHVELKTKSKMFCGCKNDPFGAEKPNIYTCPVCLGLPGALPVPQKKAIDWTIMIGLALNCKITKRSKFDRKHYFYPDLPKSYQISQYDKPLCVGGFVETSQGKVRITRVHLEEDTGKLQHKKIDGENKSLVDFNRSGVPLVEIVTEPDINSSEMAKEFARKIRDIIRNLRVSDCDMEKGTMRLEANISLGMDLGYKVEIKNVNSFRYIGKAIDYELKRQKEILDKGETPVQETRGWNENTNKTFSQRVKEEAADYRYFPEPDIPPIVTSEEEVTKIKDKIPELPSNKMERWIEEFGLRKDYAIQMSAKMELANYTQKTLEISKKEQVEADKAVGQIINKIIDVEKTSPEELVKGLKEKTSIKDDLKISSWVDEAIKELPKVAEDYGQGKEAAISALIGKVMALSKGSADGKSVKEAIQKKLRK